MTMIIDFQQHFLLNFLRYNPAFLPEFSSIFAHSLLLIGLAISWLCKVLSRTPGVDHVRKDTNYRRHYKPVLFTCLALSMYSVVLLCYFDYFTWSSISSDRERLVFQIELVLRVLAWLLVYVYLQCLFIPSSNSGWKFPVFLKFWWGFNLVVSSFRLVLRDECMKFEVLGWSDVVFVISGIFFCFIGNSEVAVHDDTDDVNNIRQPLLGGTQNQILESRYIDAGFVSNVTFSWVGSLISKGYKKRLDLDDVPSLYDKDNVNESYAIFRKCLESAKGSSTLKVSTLQLAQALIFATWPSILWTSVFYLLNTLAAYVGPYLIDSFVQYLNGMKVSTNEGYVLISTFLVAKLVECLSLTQLEFGVQVIALRTRAVLIKSIYKKALNLSCMSKEDRTSGEMINLMSVDAERVGQFSVYLHHPWTISLKVVLALLILHRTLGLASIAALVATVLAMLVNYPLSSMYNKYYGNLLKSKDKRMKATTEILKNMRILKLQAWDMKFLSKILELRKIENEWLRKSLHAFAMTTSMFWMAPIFVSGVAFSTCIIIGIPLNTGKILSAISTFKLLQTAIHDLPGMISAIIETKVSLSRIASFISLDELDPESIEKLPKCRMDSEPVVEVCGGNFTWDVSAPSCTLKDINIKVDCGMKVAICGTVGSGKSTLLSCILGEVSKTSGILRLKGSTAYVPQTPWIQSGMIVDNILFGKDMDVEKYNRVLEACSLKKDLEDLQFADQTIIGERGINLSGGQKQRMQIARALYHDADIYLLDDPFSAVDAHTGTHIFKECVLGLLESKTVLYVTHQVEFLPVADLILVMKEGRIEQVGKYEDILHSSTDLLKLMVAQEHALSSFDSVETENSIAGLDEENTEKRASEEDEDSEIDVEAVRPKGQVVQEEERVEGRVGVRVYWQYITTAYKGSLVLFILLCQVMFQILQILSNYWIAWAAPTSLDTEPAVDDNTLLVVYGAMAIGSCLVFLVRSLLLVTAGYKTATLLFCKMHSSLFSAPMSFFDANPSARILNRASTDQSAADMITPNRVAGFAFSVISLLGVIGVMSLVIWQVYMIFVPVIFISLWYQQYYLPAARELFRLFGVNKAPVIQHYAESISGAAIIRSFGQESRFCETSARLINRYLKPKFYNTAATQWLKFRLDMLSSLIFACTLFFLVSIPVGSISPVIAGLAVTYALNLNYLQSRVITNLAIMENRIISVERILQYTRIPSEAPLVVENNRPDQSWPSCGRIDVQDLQVRYAPQLPLVLRGITCTFRGGKKTGIVGRTGCGKSTLIEALFRTVEPDTGQIIIDGINISSIGLHDLRSKISIIPQDPTMFQGTIRSNLDPLEEYTDEQIWEALDKCQLGDEVRNKERKLDSTVNENGENWSVGQRQLVCLGRVLLKRSKVLVLDEATASVDTATDNTIQQTLREQFADSTVIIVAHRITSVTNSDHVVVLSHGVVKESDTPSRLLSNQYSSFSKLVAEYKRRFNSGNVNPRK